MNRVKANKMFFLWVTLITMSDYAIVMGTYKSNYTVKPVLSDHSKRIPKIVYQNELSLNAG